MGHAQEPLVKQTTAAVATRTVHTHTQPIYKTRFCKGAGFFINEILAAFDRRDRAGHQSFQLTVR